MTVVLYSSLLLHFLAPELDASLSCGVLLSLGLYNI